MHSVRSGRRTARRVSLVVALALVSGPPSSARATQIAVRARVACALEATSSMAFGGYDTMSNNPLDELGRVAYRCYRVAPPPGSVATAADDDSGQRVVTISISAGNSGNFNRYMSGPERLRYNIYLDASKTSVWGDGTGGTNVYTGQVDPNNQTTTVPVFGRAFGGQDVVAGAYGDNLIVTLDF